MTPSARKKIGFPTVEEVMEHVSHQPAFLRKTANYLEWERFVNLFITGG